jgi:hypothetical protein
VARILGDGTRQRTRVFSELPSHDLFADRFGRPGKGNDISASASRIGVNLDECTVTALDQRTAAVELLEASVLH